MRACAVFTEDDFLRFLLTVACTGWQLCKLLLNSSQVDAQQQGRSQDSRVWGFPPALRMCVTIIRALACTRACAQVSTTRGTFFGVAAAGGYGYSGRRSGFGRHSALRRLIVMYILVAATGATVPLSLSTLITGSLRYKVERGQALHLSPRSASHKCPRARARSN